MKDSKQRIEKLVEHVRHEFFNYATPTYFLDESYYIRAWNLAFEELFAKPMGLYLGQHAAEFVGRWENSEEALARSAKVFSVGKVPFVDHEQGQVKLKKYGVVKIQKMATQVHFGDEMGWGVTYSVRDFEKFDLFMDDMMKIFAEDVKSRIAGK